MPSGHENPKLAEIDQALFRLEESIVHLTNQWGYEVGRSGEGAFDVPHRWFRRTTETDEWLIHHSVEIKIGVPISVRLKRGFYPGIPLNIAVQATLWLPHFNPFQELILWEPIVEGLPYNEAKVRLADLFQKAKSLHDRWDREFISEHGETIEEFIARSKEDDGEDSDNSP